MTTWDDIYKNFNEGGPAWATLGEELHPAFLAFLERAEFSCRKALDIGCGEGKYLKFLQEVGFRTTGLDSSPTAVQMAKVALEGKGQWIVADMFEFAYPAAAFDLVLSHATLHHGPKTRVVELIHKIHTMLVPDGNLFLTLPSEESKKKWPMMEGHQILEDGTCVPTRGPEKGLAHSFFSLAETVRLFAGKYKGLSITTDPAERWVVSGTRK